MNRPTREQYTFEIIVSVTLLLVFLLVTGTGILSYFRLDHIIDTVKSGIRPDRKLILVKEITNNLSEAESSVKSYSLTRDVEYIDRFYELTEATGTRFEELGMLVSPGEPMGHLIDSLDGLVEQKFTILDRLLEIQDEFRVQQAMNRLMESLREEEARESITVSEMRPGKPAGPVNQVKEDTLAKRAVPVIPEKKESFFKRLFSKKDRDKQTDTVVKVTIPPPPADTVFILQKTEIKPPMEQISRHVEMVKRDALIRENILRQQEWILLQQDHEIMGRIRSLLTAMELLEARSQATATRNAEEKAGEVKLILIAFGVSASILLLLTALIIYRYVRRNNEYGRVLTLARVEAEELARTKERFLANMSHEIRTPMNIIAGFTRHLLDSPLENEQRDQLEMVKKSSDHLLQIMNDILDLSKLQAGKMELLEMDFSPAKVLADMKSWLEPAAMEKNITLEASVDENLPAIVRGDAVRLRQILFNLAGNAVKFTGHGLVRIQAYPGPSNADRTNIVFEISDTGIGIPGSDLDKIFEEFERGAGPAGKNAGGTGLGLAITRMLVDLLGGKIQVSSAVGSGTTFKVTIPFLKSAVSAVPVREESLPGRESLQGLKILVVDDEEYNLRLMKAILGKYGCNCLEARSGEEALSVVRRNEFDAVLLDIRLPGISGIETARKMLEEHPKGGRKVPVIAVSAAVSAADMAEVKKAGFDGILSKPFQEEQLVRTLVEIVIGPGESASHAGPSPADAVVGYSLSDDRSSPVYDLGPLKETSAGDINFFWEMVNLFIRDTDEGIREARRRLEAGDWDMAADLLHKISPPCRHLKAERLYGLMKEAERLLRENGGGKQVRSLVDQAVKEFESIRQHINSSHEE